MDIIFIQFTDILGGTDFIMFILGIVLAWVIVFNIVDYIMD